MSLKALPNITNSADQDQLILRLRKLIEESAPKQQAQRSTAQEQLHQAVCEIKIGAENQRSQQAIDTRAFRELTCLLLNQDDVDDPSLFLHLLR